MNFLQLDSEVTTIQADTLFFVGSIPVTNTMLAGLFTTLILTMLAVFVYRHTSDNGRPSKVQSAAEIVLEAIIGFIEQITGDRRVALSILPVVGSLFIYIAFANLITTLFPLLSAFEYDGVTMFRTPTNDFNGTVSLAAGMVILSHYLSIKKYSAWGHFNKFIKIGYVVGEFRKGISAGLLSFIEFFVGLLDIVSEFAKIISLSLRLFGNMFAGEVLLVVFMSLLAILAPVPLVFLGLMSGVIQAVVFSALVSSYISLAIKD